MRRALLMPITILALLVAPQVASAKTFWLDVHDTHKDRWVGPVKMLKLQKDVPYVATVRGTFSLFAAAGYNDPAHPICGTTLPRPIFPSPHVRNGRVLADAVYFFGSTATDCAKRKLPAPRVTFQWATGRKFVKLAPIGGYQPAPTRSHAYHYALGGTGKAVRARLYDSPASDNYGRLRIRFRRAVPADCQNKGYTSWGYLDEATCVADTQR